MLIGLLPIIYYNFKYNGQLANFISRNLYITDNGTNNFQFIRNLLIRISHLGMLMNQDMYSGGHSYLFRNFPLFFFIFTIISLFYFIFIRRKMIFSNRRCILILSVTLLTFIFSTFTFTAFYPGHLYILFPYPQIIMAVAIYTIIRFLKHRPLKILFSSAVVMLLVAEGGKCSESYRIYKNRMKACQDKLFVN
jgi:4-amino-4-deoxy-L-arabinose transferase-like glycosyltransferase